MPRYRCRNCGKSYYSASAISFRCVVCGNNRFETVSSSGEMNDFEPTEGRRIAPGDHALFLYDDDALFLDYALPFMREGLEREEKVIFVINARLCDALTESTEPAERGAIDVVQSNQRYGADFDPERTLAGYERDIAATPGPIRVFAAADFNGTSISPGDLLSYEAAAHKRLIADRTCAVCAYDTRNASEYVVRAARRVHPVRSTGHNCTFVENSAFDPTVLV